MMNGFGIFWTVQALGPLKTPSPRKAVQYRSQAARTLRLLGIDMRRAPGQGTPREERPSRLVRSCQRREAREPPIATAQRLPEVLRTAPALRVLRPDTPRLPARQPHPKRTIRDLLPSGRLRRRLRPRHQKPRVRAVSRLTRRQKTGPESGPRCQKRKDDNKSIS